MDINFDPTVAIPSVTSTPVRPAGQGTPQAQYQDAFARAAGPDVEVARGSEMVRVYAVFALDPETKKLRVSVVDDAGRLIRMIPPESVAEMLSAMAQYSG